MEVFLVISLAFIWLFGYFFMGKDFFAPAVMITFSFFVSSILACYVLTDFHYSLSFEVVIFLIIAMLLCVMIGSCCHWFIRRINIKNSHTFVKKLPINFYYFALFIILLYFVLQINFINKIVGSSSFAFSNMTQYRYLTAYSDDIVMSVPFYIRQMSNLVAAVSIITMFNHIKFYKEMSPKGVILSLVVYFCCAIGSLLSGGRFTLAIYISSAIVLLHLQRIQKIGVFKSYKFKSIFYVLLVFLCSMLLFYISKEMVGRVSDKDFIEYAAHYFGKSIINLDVFYNYMLCDSDVWGKETFYAFVNLFRKMGFLNIDYYIFHLEFNELEGESFGNVYTLFRPYINDFGVYGAYLLFSIIIVIYSLLYEFVKYNQGDIWIVLFSAIYFPVFLSSYAEFFCSRVLSVGYFIQLLMTYTIFRIFMKNNIKIKV